MANRFYNHGTTPVTGTKSSSTKIRVEFDNITTGFNGVASEVDQLKNSPTVATLPHGTSTTQPASTEFVQQELISASIAPVGIQAVVGGSTQVSSATGIVLTSASTRIQQITFTAAYQSVTLPDATTMLEGGAIFVLRNIGVNAFALVDSTGELKGTVAAGYSAVVYLLDNTTAKGTWAIGLESYLPSSEHVYPDSIYTANAISTTYPCVASMSATQAIVAYIGTSGYVTACTLNVSGTTLSAGATLVVNAVSSQYVAITKMSTTQAIISYMGTSTHIEACTLNVSGTTLTNGTVLGVTAVITNGLCSLATLSSTQAVLTYINSSYYLATCTLNVSGTTLTNGAILVVNAVSSNYNSVTAMSATQAIAVYSEGNTPKACTLNISGTTITNGTILAVDAGNSGVMTVAKVSTTQAVFSYLSLGYLKTCTLNVSGTNLTNGTILSTGIRSGGSYIGSAQINGTQVIVTFTRYTTQYVSAVVVNVFGTNTFAGPSVDINAVASTYNPSVSLMTGTQSIVAYKGVSNFLQTCLLELSVS